jgi:putative transposase
MSLGHPWKSSGQKRTIVWSYEPPNEIIQYLKDMQDAIRYALQVAYRDALREGRICSPILLRKEIRDWFYARYDYARHHINPVCGATLAMLKSYKKAHQGNLRIPEVKRLAMRISGGLFKIVGDRLRVTLQPRQYIWLPMNTRNKHFQEYAAGTPSELLLTDSKVCLTCVVRGQNEKSFGASLPASDLNFRSIDMTTAIRQQSPAELVGVGTEPLNRITQIQNDFSRRRERLQKRVKNPQKRLKKLKETRGRQRNRIKDALHKLSTKMVKEDQDTTFVFEDLRHVRKSGEGKGKRFRTYLNRWPYRMYQRFVDYKSLNRTLYVNPRGTSSECPVCGGKLEHPTWGMSRCNNCGVDYDRNRLASLAILCRGARLCGQNPFAVSADASWQQMRDEYLYTGGKPGRAAGAGWTDAASAPNKDVVP